MGVESVIGRWASSVGQYRETLDSACYYGPFISGSLEIAPHETECIPKTPFGP